MSKNCRMQLLSIEEHNPPVRQPEYAFREAVIIMSKKTKGESYKLFTTSYFPSQPSCFTPLSFQQRELKCSSETICTAKERFEDAFRSNMQQRRKTLSQHNFGSSYGLPISPDSCSIHGKQGSSREEAWVRVLITIHILSVFYAACKASLWSYLANLKPNSWTAEQLPKMPTQDT